MEKQPKNMPKVVAKDGVDLKKIIDETIKKYGPKCDLNFIDVSKVKDMTELFRNTRFNGDISKWDVSNVTNMERMFVLSKFNGNISKWNVSKVTNMDSMFCSSQFNGDISKWDVSNVTRMDSMFGSSKFNGDISKWNVSKVTNMDSMFFKSQFNGDISKWDVSKVKEKTNMFMKSALEKAKRIPEWYTEGSKAASPKTSSKKPSVKKNNMHMLNTIVMTDAQIKKFNTLYGEKIPKVFGKKGADLKKLLSGKVNFGTEKNPPFETYDEMAEKGLEFEIRWEGTEFMVLESWGVGKGKAKDGKLWYCIDFNETRTIFLEDYDKDWDARSSEFVEHVDEYGNICQIQKLKVFVYGDRQQFIYALPVKKMLQTGKGIEKGHYAFKIPNYLTAAYDFDGRDYSGVDIGDELRCFTKDGKGEVYLLNKKGKKIKSISEFDHSEPDKDGDVYYPVPSSDLEKKAKNKPLTKEAVAKWKKKLGIK